MKFSKYFMIAGAAAMMAACSSEEPEVNGGAEQNGESAGFIKVQLGDPAEGTRAAVTDADPTANADDSKIASATFYFYAKGGSTPLFTKTVAASGADAVWKTGNTAILELDNINATEVAVIVNYKPESDAANAKVAAGKYLENGNYIMASSMYYGEGNTRTYRAAIKKIYATAEEAAASGAAVTEMYVERVVAKVNMSTAIEDLGNIAIQNVNIANTGKAAKVKFVPEHVFLTNTNQNSWVRKRLDPFNDLDDFLQSKVKGTYRSFWTAGCVGEGDRASLNLYSYNDKGDAPVWGADNTFITEYAYDHAGSTQARCTSLIVTGKYEFDSADITLTNGKFWVVAVNGKFNAYATEADAIKVMAVDGSTKDKDGKDRTLVEVADKPWLFELSDKSSPVTCMVFEGGHGYYSAPITRFTNGNDKYNAVVRNHVYNVDVNEIKGLGIGIPDLDWPIIPVDELDPAQEKAFFSVSVKVNPWTFVPQNIKW